MPLLQRKKVRYLPLPDPVQVYHSNHPDIPSASTSVSTAPQKTQPIEDDDDLLVVEQEEGSERSDLDGDTPTVGDDTKKTQTDAELVLDSEKNVFYLKESGEIFLDYESYANRVMFYHQKNFQCEATSKAPLSYFEALKSEREEARNTHEKFPKHLKGPILRSVQFQVQGRLDHLTDAVHDQFSDRFFNGERVIADVDNVKYHAIICKTHKAAPRTDPSTPKDLSLPPINPNSHPTAASNSTTALATASVAPLSPGSTLSLPPSSERGRSNSSSVPPTPDSEHDEDDENDEDDEEQEEQIEARRKMWEEIYARPTIENPHARGTDLSISLEQADKEDPPTDYVYLVRLVDGEGRGKKGQGLIQVDAQDISRDRITFSKTILKKFLKDCIDRDSSLASPWMVKPALCVKYGIPQTPDESLQAELNNLKSGAISKRKRPKKEEDVSTPVGLDGTSHLPTENGADKGGEDGEEGGGEDGPKKKKKRRRRNSQGELVAVPDTPPKMVEDQPPTPPRRRPLKYPAEDLLCEMTTKEIASGKAAQRPMFSRNLPFGQDRFETLITTWCFLNAFGKTLVLSPFTLDDFVSSLTYDLVDPPHPLTSEVHACLLNVIMRDLQPTLIARPLKTYGSNSFTSYGSLLKGKKKSLFNSVHQASLDGSRFSGTDPEGVFSENEDGDLIVAESSTRDVSVEGGQTAEEAEDDEDEEEEEEDENIIEGYPGLTKKLLLIESEKIVERSGWRDGKELKYKDGRKRWEACLVACLLQRGDIQSVPSLPRILAHLLFYPPESDELSEDDENPSWVVASSPRLGIRASLPSQRYASLPSEWKLEALAFLCEIAAQTKVAREAMDDSATALTEVRKDLIDIKRERKKLSEERHLLDGTASTKLSTEPRQSDDGLDSRAPSHMDDDGMSITSEPFRWSSTAPPGFNPEEDDMSSLSDASENELEEQAVRAILPDELMDDGSDTASLAGDSTSGRSGKISSAAIRQNTLKNQQLAKEAENLARAETLAKEREELRIKAASAKQLSAERKRIEDEDLKLLRKEEALNRDFRKHVNFPRVKPLGIDRFGNKLWWFDGIGSASLIGPGGAVIVGTGRVFLQGGNAAERAWWGEKVEFTEEEIRLKREKEEGEEGMLEEGEWAMLEDPEELTIFYDWLNPRGHRESKLINTIKHIWEYMHRGTEKRYQELQTRAQIHAQAIDTRRSTRQAVQPDLRNDPSLHWKNKKAEPTPR
ncbi:Chromatin remodeling complex WSTF-ISWI, large subunit (contains heterochromatin localization, PHD and BROMO domains) [Phaffia rhodozyma]|uniref:Chromatin remodeling complex WSTF-ISWI, large subunit (Contains heterochromatin localization, PHD and BROMO domains) n=1 Tax=Phaffia rhodozyma TaxID=264483 RepID=A0A0F7SE84_PHARH|nr:Chromatin remodeling complex WSTF-ISWI, large subunit (contains heterochromatin localization, PHD and BROMO domains) [Phaffia rhodozyma]